MSAHIELGASRESSCVTQDAVSKSLSVTPDATLFPSKFILNAIIVGTLCIS
jgi:hypothetical protein